MHRIAYKGARFGLTVDLAKHCVTMGCALAGLWLIIEGLKVIVLQRAENISALAIFVSALSPSSIFCGIFGGASFFTVLIYRHRYKRSIRMTDKFRKQLESRDPFNKGSGLTETGDTPKERR
ncbi:hypothetical protein [Paraburkholderia oxyphila]|uniref:hypothetical protein n=1 Tax=Paraburkholderia oxyphila TaxID=614212 RepID=UPI0005BE1583|nr:hypothetical protein [Paraburkholderia oxyphila]